jgi:hypothetical protein
MKMSLTFNCLINVSRNKVHSVTTMNHVRNGVGDNMGSCLEEVKVLFMPNTKMTFNGVKGTTFLAHNLFTKTWEEGITIQKETVVTLVIRPLTKASRYAKVVMADTFRMTLARTRLC